MKQVILFASGGGSNVLAILNYFKENKEVNFPLIICNKSNAGVIEIAKEWRIDVLLVNKDFFLSKEFIQQLESYHSDLLVLAGFLWKIPTILISSFPNKIINIHPALLPKYGGKGMYGNYVHEAVVENKEKESGITIHFVNENYDEGEYILQEKVAVDSFDDAISVAKKVLKLEHEYYSKVIEGLLKP